MTCGGGEAGGQDAVAYLGYMVVRLCGEYDGSRMLVILVSVAMLRSASQRGVNS